MAEVVVSDDPSSGETVATMPRAPRGDAGDLQRGAVVGRYVVLSRQGAGGMGVVYAAYDPELDRKVALKLLLPRADEGVGDDHRRLVREAQAMAQLGHPNVVAVHDVGEHEGRVFVAMEFVQGCTLKAWSRAEPRRWPQVLEVLLAAGRGLASAHERGLVHRDFKADNVMVADDARVRVMDFGLARVDETQSTLQPIEDTASQPRERALGLELTLRGAVMGTPGYMAPEQLRNGEASTAADQFAYCVTLWEALYGQRPFVGDTLIELVAKVMNGEIAEPPASARVPAWLRRVLERGLRIEPVERYRSMAELLAVLERGADRRHRAWLLATVGMLALVGVGVWAAWRLGVERRRAQCESEASAIAEVWNDEAKNRLHDALVATGVSYAHSTFEHAVPFVDAHVEAWRGDYATLCVATIVDRTRSEELWAASRDCLDERRGELGSLVDVLTEEADATAAARTVLAAAGLAHRTPCDDATLNDDASFEAGDVDVQALRQQLWRAQGLGAAGKYAEALDMARAVVGQAEVSGHVHLHRSGLLLAGALAEETGAYDESERLLGEAFDSALAADDDNHARDAATALVYTLGVSAARPDEGLWWGRVARGLVVRLGDDDELTAANVDESVAGVHSSLGAHDEAQRLYERALAISERVLGPDHPDVASLLNNLAIVHGARGSYDEAQRLHERALGIWERVFGPDHPDVASSLNNLAVVHGTRGSYDEAQRLFERALAIRERTLGPDHPDVATSLNNLAVLARDRGSYDEARMHAERALELFTRLEAGPERLAEVQFVLAQALWATGDRTRARGLARTVRDNYRDAGAGHEAALAEVETWIAARGVQNE